MKFEDISARVDRARAERQEVVVVLGLGFVGTAVAANLARTRSSGSRAFFVIGLDQDTSGGRAKAERLDQGRSPTYANDESLERVVGEACAEPKALVGTVDPRVLSLADVVVSCINLDLERASGQTEHLVCRTDGYAQAMRMVGRHVRPGTLVTVESTLPLGTCDQVLYPALCQGQREQGVDVEAHPPLLAFCYERVMPGPDYLDSVNNYWRAIAGINEASTRRAQAFLSKYVNTAQYPLWGHKSTRAAEMSKLLENAYRATNIAFIEEWAELAERAGVDLFDVIASIRLRRGTHDNMMRPGLGVGGYCLTKDALLAVYGAENLLGIDADMPFSRRAILTNEKMPERAVAWARSHFAGKLRGKRVVLVGVTYRPGVADTRSSPSEIVARAFQEQGASVEAYDPLVPTWDELPELRMHADPAAALAGADVAVICLPDAQYRSFLPSLLASSMKPGGIVVDPWDMVGDDVARALEARGVALRVYGRGDVPNQVGIASATPRRVGKAGKPAKGAAKAAARNGKAAAKKRKPVAAKPAGSKKAKARARARSK